MTDSAGRKLGIFLPSLEIGGAERVVLEIVRGFTGLGWSVEVYTMVESGTLRDELGPSAETICLNVPNYRMAIRELAQVYDRTRPDIVLSTLYMNDVVAIAARWFSHHKPRIVAGAHNSLRHKIRHPDNRKDGLLLRPLAWFTFPFADAIVAVSKGVANELCQMLRLRSERVYTVYNPVVDEGLLRRIGQHASHPFVANDRPFRTIVAVGRFAPQKGFDDLLAAFSRVRSRRDCRLILIGDGSEAERLRAISTDLGIDRDVAFTGALPNPLPLVAASDLFVMSSRWEGLGNVLIEALACGTPVVATDCDFGPSEILAGGRFGFLAPVADPIGLAGAIELALDTPSSDPRKSPALLRQRAAEFSCERAVEGYLDVFESIRR